MSKQSNLCNLIVCIIVVFLTIHSVSKMKLSFIGSDSEYYCPHSIKTRILYLLLLLLLVLVVVVVVVVVVVSVIFSIIGLFSCADLTKYKLLCDQHY
jgi:hypothetical protein